MVRWSLLFIAALTFGSCASATAPSDPTSSIRSYSYPFTNGLQYKYARFSTNLLNSDTSIFQILASINPNDPSSIVTTGKGKDSAGILLYHFILGKDPVNGSPTLTLSNAKESFFALEGDLSDSSTWVADETTSTTARLFAHYDEYVPDPKLGTSFTDVLAVRYHRATDPQDSYTLRFFAKNFGLILEKDIVGSTVVIGTLQLLEVGTLLSLQRHPAQPPL